MGQESSQAIHRTSQYLPLHAELEPNVIKINEPVIIIGDIHGQFYDLLKIMSLFPSLDPLPKEHLLFLGDYVDRGPQGMEVILVLMALKVKFP